MTATAVVLAAVLGLQIVRAQGESVAAGVYTDEQAKRGMAVYKEKCASCHGDDLKGTDVVPGLSDNAFWGYWSEKSVGDLFEKINTSMPATAPGSLTVVQTADIVAHILNAQKFPAGTTELASKLEDLKPIMLAKPTP